MKDEYGELSIPDKLILLRVLSDIEEKSEEDERKIKELINTLFGGTNE